MTDLIDNYLLQSGMPQEELCMIGRSRRAFYYYGMLVMGATGVSLAVLGLFNMMG